MDIYDSEGEFLEVYIVMLLTDNEKLDPFKVIENSFHEEPFSEFGEALLDNGLDHYEGEVVLNTEERCVVKVGELFYVITRAAVESGWEYTVVPQVEFVK